MIAGIITASQEVTRIKTDKGIIVIQLSVIKTQAAGVEPGQPEK